MEFEKLDRIVLTMDDVQTIMKWGIENKDKVEEFNFPLEEGLLLYKQEFAGMEVTALIHFKIDLNGLHVKTYDNKDKSPIISYTLSGDDGIGIKDLKILAEGSRLKSKLDLAEKDAFITIKILINTFIYMTTFPKYFREEKVVKNISKKTKIKKQSKNNKRKIIKVGVTTYSIYNQSDEDERRKYERHAKAWQVRGFYRYIKKSNKYVWVKPHIRGEGEVESKEYRI